MYYLYNWKTFFLTKINKKLNNWVKLFTLFFGGLLLPPSSLQAQVCCPTTNHQAVPSLEGALTPNLKFPNSTLSTTNNSIDVVSSSSTSYLGWDAASNNWVTFSVIKDASRASDGTNFAYLPPLVGNTLTVCIFKTKMPFAPQTSCTGLDDILTEGKRYRVSFDWVPFDRSNPNGTTNTAIATAEYVQYTPSVPLVPIPLYKPDGSAVTARAGVSWANVATSWERVYGVYTAAPTATTAKVLFAYSHKHDDLAGTLMDNMKVEEIGMTADGIASIAADCTVPASGKITFTLNPTGTTPSGLLYTVTAPTGYTISPTQGTYGSATAFTLSKTSGSAPGSGNVSINLTDAVNTNCSLAVTVTDPGACATCTAPSAITLTQTAPTCTGTTANNDGKITFISATSANKYFINSGTTSTGTYATALAIPATGTDLQTAILNAGATYTVRFFNGADNCATTQTVTIAPVTCTPPPCAYSITNPSAIQTLCAGATGANITVSTNQNFASSIKFVKFTTDQTSTNGSETATELTAIYAGTAIGSNVTPTGASSPYTATYTWNSADFPNAGTTQIIYYVYAILDVAVSAACQPVQEIKITVNPLPSFTLAQTNVTCNGVANGTIIVTTTGGTALFTYSKDDGATFPNTDGIFGNLTPATYKIAVKDANGCVKKCN